jgi:hypothetical protein
MQRSQQEELKAKEVGFATNAHNNALRDCLFRFSHCERP